MHTLLQRIGRWPAGAWLALQAAALAPAWWWMARRLADGADDPLGLLALATLAVVVWQVRGSLRATPAQGWLLLAGLGTLAASGLRAIGAPSLVAALAAVLALACGLRAFLPRRIAAGPVLGLAVLALPLLSSLQFYAGYPLRVVAAEAGRWLLSPFFTVVREGTALSIDGQLVIVDAPCSGVQMVWLGYFSACCVALWAGIGSRRFVARLPWVGGLVLVGNVVRSSVLAALEAGGHAPSATLHSLLGLVILALVCGGIAWQMARANPPVAARPACGTMDAVRHPQGGRHADCS